MGRRYECREGGSRQKYQEVSRSGFPGSLPLAELISLLLLTEFSFILILKMALLQAEQHYRPPNLSVPLKMAELE